MEVVVNILHFRNLKTKIVLCLLRKTSLNNYGYWRIDDKYLDNSIKWI
jgi:hypothetical protein